MTSFWITLITVLQIVSALLMVGLILMQHGKGADMGASFGTGSAGSVFGSAGSANFLSRWTAWCATVFFLCTLALAYAGGLSQKGGSSKALEGLNAPVSATSGPAKTGADLIPGAAPASAVVSRAASAAISAATSTPASAAASATAPAASSASKP